MASFLKHSNCPYLLFDPGSQTGQAVLGEFLFVNKIKWLMASAQGKQD